MNYIYVGDYGFPIPFESDYDLTGMSDVRMLIKKPRGSASIPFATGDFSTVGVGDTISYTVRAEDLGQPGRYEFQIVAKVDGALDIAFDPRIVHVRARASKIAWA